jgi:hypothetical protein
VGGGACAVMLRPPCTSSRVVGASIIGSPVVPSTWCAEGRMLPWDTPDSQRSGLAKGRAGEDGWHPWAVMRGRRRSLRRMLSIGAGHGLTGKGKLHVPLDAARLADYGKTIGLRSSASCLRIPASVAGSRKFCHSPLAGSNHTNWAGEGYRSTHRLC